MKKIIVLLLAIVVCLSAYILASKLAESSDSADEQDVIDYAQEIVGKWEPVEMSTTSLTFSRYGTMCIDDGTISLNYSVEDNVVKISLLGFINSEFNVYIYPEDDDMFLEIYDTPVFAGKYKRQKSTPRTTPVEYVQEEPESPNNKVVAKTPTTKTVKAAKPSSSTTNSVRQATNPQLVVEKPVVEAQPEVREEAPRKEVAEEKLSIYGRWEPVEGAQHSLDITKYGTVIQWYGPVDMRHEYSLNGDVINIGYDKNAKIVLSKDSNNVYLEIYKSEHFSGKYKLSKKAPSIQADVIDKDLYEEAIVGKWEPVYGVSRTLEISKYGTAIQWYGPVDMRHEYTIKQNRIKIGYDDNATIVISKNSKNTYLEIYNSEHFSGLYKLVSDK